MMIVFLIDYRLIIQAAYLIYGISIAAFSHGILLRLYITWFTKMAIGGGFFAFQPSELMKLVMIITLARYFDDHKSNEPYKLKELFILVLIVSLPFLLILKQPDLGTALMYNDHFHFNCFFYWSRLEIFNHRFGQRFDINSHWLAFFKRLSERKIDYISLIPKTIP